MKTTNLDQSPQIKQDKTTICLEKALPTEAPDKLQQQAQEIMMDEEKYLNSQVQQPDRESNQSINLAKLPPLHKHRYCKDNQH